MGLSSSSKHPSSSKSSRVSGHGNWSNTTSVPLALPLLEGLLHKKDRGGKHDDGDAVNTSSTADTSSSQEEAQQVIAREAFEQFRAGRLLARWCAKRSKALKNSPSSAASKKRRRKRAKKSKSPEKSRSDATSDSNSSSDLISNSHHWLIQALQGYSHPQRQAALQLLAQVPLDDYHIWVWIDLLQYLLSTTSTAASSSSDRYTTASLSWLALLQHALEMAGPSSRLAFSFRGIPWLTRKLYESTIATTASSTTQNRVMRQWQDGVVTLLKFVILDASDEESSHVATKIQQALWKVQTQTPDSTSISPLACLVGTYHTLQHSPVTLPKNFKNRPQAATLEALAALVDPTSESAAIVSKGLSQSDKASSYRTLLESFQCSSTSTVEAAASTTIDTVTAATDSTANVPSPALSSPARRLVQGSRLLRSHNHNLVPSRPDVESPSHHDHHSQARAGRFLADTLNLSDSDSDDGGEVNLQNVIQQRRSQRGTNHENEANEMDMLRDDEDEDDDDDEEMSYHQEDHDQDADDDDMDEDDEGGDGDEEDEENGGDQDGDQEDNEHQEGEEEHELVMDSDEGEDEEVIEGDHGLIVQEEDIHDHESEVDAAHLEAARLLRGSSEIPEEPTAPPKPDTEISKDRKRALLKACMQVLQHQHLPLQAEQSLLECMMDIVRPPKKPLNTKLILRRAPTQEEFFRGNLSRNPIALSMLKNNKDPTVGDLRQWIADDLQMSDSAELLEILVANKILGVDLKLRVINQVLWKTHLLESNNSSSSGGGLGFLSSRGSGAPSFFSGGSGLSMIFSSLDRGVGGSGGNVAGTNRGITEDSPLSALPPMVCTYRLTGVDGEATEDTVTTLADPEEPSENSPEEREKLIEQEYGITRLLTEGNGVLSLLRATERHLSDVLRKIRRDSIDEGPNSSREKFKETQPYIGLNLLVCCSQLSSNRKLLLEFRAPTVLLRLLLNVLHALEEGDASLKESESNATAKVLQELIETLSSEISNVPSSASQLANSAQKATSDDEDASTLRLLISSIETSSLSRPLRNVIAKLLPYLTYGQLALCKELAQEFDRHVSVEGLVNDSGNQNQDVAPEDRSALMDTFVHTSISLPPNEVCNSLRSQLVECGFVGRVAHFLTRSIPSAPPPWSPSLWSKDEDVKNKDVKALQKEWRDYLQRPGLKTALNMLIGITKQHPPTQSFLASVDNVLRACHWMEATSDNATLRIEMDGLGLVSETLLDEMSEENPVVSKQVSAIRRKTRDRKKEIALAKRSKTLTNMGSFGKSAPEAPARRDASSSSESAPVRGAAASLLGPIVDRFFRDTNSSSSSGDDRVGPAAKRQKIAETIDKPAWMLEMEQMEDETGLTCAVCQEGRTLQPSELIGLYAYVKKVSVPSNQCGGRSYIDGTELLIALPPRLPESLADDVMLCELWYPVAKTIGNQLKEQNRSSPFGSASTGRRATYFTTTVSAGNAIHSSCHSKARQADRNHPKAPKSEWEGASLRNSRVNCNVILPLVSSRSSKVPLVAVDAALTEHQTAISNLLGVRPKSMLWCVLHDVRFLLLRMAYGEALNADCGGGSLLSNAQLLYYQLLMADMFEKDAQVDSPQTSQHARNLSAGFLVASAIVDAKDYARDTSSLSRAIADAAPMAALTCVLFHNHNDEFGSTDNNGEDCTEPHPKRRWILARENFLRGLIRFAGRRHALGIENSGCLSGRCGNKRSRSSSFADWDMLDEEDEGQTIRPDLSLSRPGIRQTQKAGIEDFRDALRPALVYFAIMEQVSADFVVNMDDCKVAECSDRLVEVIKTCQGSRNIRDLVRNANVTMEDSEIIIELQKGMVSA